MNMSKKILEEKFKFIVHNSRLGSGGPSAASDPKKFQELFTQGVLNNLKHLKNDDTDDGWTYHQKIQAIYKFAKEHSNQAVLDLATELSIDLGDLQKVAAGTLDLAPPSGSGEEGDEDDEDLYYSSDEDSSKSSITSVPTPGCDEAGIKIKAVDYSTERTPEKPVKDRAIIDHKKRDEVERLKAGGVGGTGPETPVGLSKVDDTSPTSSPPPLLTPGSATLDGEEDTLEIGSMILVESPAAARADAATSPVLKSPESEGREDGTPGCSDEAEIRVAGIDYDTDTMLSPDVELKKRVETYKSGTKESEFEVPFGTPGRTLESDRKHKRERVEVSLSKEEIEDIFKKIQSASENLRTGIFQSKIISNMKLSSNVEYLGGGDKSGDEWTHRQKLQEICGFAIKNLKVFDQSLLARTLGVKIDGIKKIADGEDYEKVREEVVKVSRAMHGIGEVSDRGLSPSFKISEGEERAERKLIREESILSTEQIEEVFRTIQGVSEEDENAQSKRLQIFQERISQNFLSLSDDQRQQACDFAIKNLAGTWEDKLKLVLTFEFGIQDIQSIANNVIKVEEFEKIKEARIQVLLNDDELEKIFLNIKELGKDKEGNDRFERLVIFAGEVWVLMNGVQKNERAEEILQKICTFIINDLSLSESEWLALFPDNRTKAWIEEIAKKGDSKTVREEESIGSIPLTSPVRKDEIVLESEVETERRRDSVSSEVEEAGIITRGKDLEKKAIEEIFRRIEDTKEKQEKAKIFQSDILPNVRYLQDDGEAGWTRQQKLQAICKVVVENLRLYEQVLLASKLNVEFEVISKIAKGEDDRKRIRETESITRAIEDTRSEDTKREEEAVVIRDVGELYLRGEYTGSTDRKVAIESENLSKVIEGIEDDQLTEIAKTADNSRFLDSLARTEKAASSQGCLSAIAKNPLAEESTLVTVVQHAESSELVTELVESWKELPSQVVSALLEKSFVGEEQLVAAVQKVENSEALAAIVESERASSAVVAEAAKQNPAVTFSAAAKRIAGSSDVGQTAKNLIAELPPAGKAAVANRVARKLWG